MIRAWIFLGIWAVLPAQGQVVSAALYTEFETTPSPAVVQAIEAEVDSIMAPNGLHFVWRAIPETTYTAWPDLAVLKFSGRCEVLPAANPGHPQRLGWTHISDNIVLPFAEIDCDAIGAFLVRDLSVQPPQTREPALGRAIGRIVAHELLHIFAESRSHSDHGVDHPTLTVRQLLADQLNFAELDPTMRIMHAGSVPQPAARVASVAAGRVSYDRGGCIPCHGDSGKGTNQGPALRFTERKLNSVTLPARLAKSQDKMCRRARSMKVARPSIDEDEISDLVRYLNAL